MEHRLDSSVLITDAIDSTSNYLKTLGYAESTLNQFHRTWSHFIEYAFGNGLHFLTIDNCHSFLRNEYKIEPYEVKLTSYKCNQRRAIFMLLEYQATRSVKIRRPISEHKIPDEYNLVVSGYLQTLRDQGLSTSTYNFRKLKSIDIANYLLRNKVMDIRYIQIDDINGFIQTLIGLAKSTISSFLLVFRQLLKFAFDKKYLDVDYSTQFPQVQTNPGNSFTAVYTNEEIKRILSSVDRGNPNGKRDYAILMLGVRYGIRVSDIRDMQFSNIDFDTSTIKITQRKTKSTIEYELFPDVGWAIIDYLKYGRPKSNSKCIFVQHRAPYDKFSEYSHFYIMINKYLKAAGVSPPEGCRRGMHALRFSLASNLLSQNVPIHVVAQVLGHENINTTTIYTKIDMPQLSMCALEVPYETK